MSTVRALHICICIQLYIHWAVFLLVVARNDQLLRLPGDLRFYLNDYYGSYLIDNAIHHSYNANYQECVYEQCLLNYHEECAVVMYFNDTNFTSCYLYDQWRDRGFSVDSLRQNDYKYPQDFFIPNQYLMLVGLENQCADYLCEDGAIILDNITMQSVSGTDNNDSVCSWQYGNPNYESGEVWKSWDLIVVYQLCAFLKDEYSLIYTECVAFFTSNYKVDTRFYMCDFSNYTGNNAMDIYFAFLIGVREEIDINRGNPVNMSHIFINQDWIPSLYRSTFHFGYNECVSIISNISSDGDVYSVIPCDIPTISPTQQPSMAPIIISTIAESVEASDNAGVIALAIIGSIVGVFVILMSIALLPV